jgi:flagellar biosynthesis GTPase FlhF
MQKCVLLKSVIFEANKRDAELHISQQINTSAAHKEAREEAEWRLSETLKAKADAARQQDLRLEAVEKRHREAQEEATAAAEKRHHEAQEEATAVAEKKHRKAQEEATAASEKRHREAQKQEQEHNNNNVLLLQHAPILLPKYDPLLKILTWRIKALILLPHPHGLLLPLSLQVATTDVRTILVVLFWNMLLETTVKKNIFSIDLVKCTRVQIWTKG